MWNEIPPAPFCKGGETPASSSALFNGGRDAGIDRIAQLVTFYATTAQIDQALNEALALQIPAFLSMPLASARRTLTSSNFAAM
jgi:hypothetical protein